MREIVFVMRFFSGLLAFFLSFDELQNWQRGVRQVRVTHSLFVQKDSGEKTNHILDIFNSIKLCSLVT